MELTYTRMNRKLSVAAAVLQALVIILDVGAFFASFSGLKTSIDPGAATFYVATVIFNSILSLAFAVMLFVVLLRARKDVLSGIFLLLPVVTSGLSLAISILANIILSISEGVFNSYGTTVLNLVNFLEILLLQGVLAIACFTKGRLFGEKGRIVLLITAGISILLNMFSQLFTTVIVTMLSNSITFIGYQQIFLMTLKDPTTWVGLISRTPIYATAALMALAFFFPDKQKVETCEE